MGGLPAPPWEVLEVDGELRFAPAYAAAVQVMAHALYMPLMT